MPIQIASRDSSNPHAAGPAIGMPVTMGTATWTKSSAPALNSTLSKVGSILSDSPLARLDVTMGITIIFVGSRSGGRLLQLLSPCPLLLSAQSGGYREEAVERQVPRHRCCWAALSLRELQHG